ncbi:MAG: hypothetical protein J7J52_02055 [Deltaproteobacteria bacterium]|nr:hypothetical protein [Deltaproteobacteria bacterium]
MTENEWVVDLRSWRLCACLQQAGLCVRQGKGTRFIKEALNRIEEENSDKKDILVTSAIQP